MVLPQSDIHICLMTFPQHCIQTLKPQETKKAPVIVKKEIQAPAQEVVLTKQVKVEKVEEVSTRNIQIFLGQGHPMAFLSDLFLQLKEIIMPVQEPQLQQRLQAPPPPKALSQPPQQEPSPELPTFLKQFAEMEWFTEVYPDKKVNTFLR